MRPPKSILDRAFKYVDSTHTDLKETFRKIREAQANAGRRIVELPKPLTKGKA